MWQGKQMSLLKSVTRQQIVKSQHTVNYRPVFSSERTHWKQNNVTVQRKKRKINSGRGSQREARYPDLLVDWLSVARRTPTPTEKITEKYRPDFSSEREPHINKPETVKNNHRQNEKNWSRVPGECLIPRQTGRQTVSRTVTLTLTEKTFYVL
jgi:hypothetical protein